jgi:flagellar biosynthesis/type III secretory pathway protein FliH
MTTSELGLFVLMAIACILWAIVSYSMGYKEGHKEGYQRGRAVGRHASAQAVSK